MKPALKQMAAEVVESIKTYVMRETLKLAEKMDTSDKILDDHDRRIAELEGLVEKLRQIRRVV